MYSKFLMGLWWRWNNEQPETFFGLLNKNIPQPDLQPIKTKRKTYMCQPRGSKLKDVRFILEYMRLLFCLS